MRCRWTITIAIDPATRVPLATAHVSCSQNVVLVPDLRLVKCLDKAIMRKCSKESSDGGLCNMADTDEEASQPNTEAAIARDKSAGKRRRRVRVSLATLVGLMTLATVALTLKDQLFPGDSQKTSVSITPNSGEIPRYDGIAGHLAESRALLDFFSQHDNGVVYLRSVSPNFPPRGARAAVTTSLQIQYPLRVAAKW
jgi:hypothetical protein